MDTQVPRSTRTAAPTTVPAALVVAGAVVAAAAGLFLNGLLRRAAVTAEQVEERAYCR